MVYTVFSYLQWLKAIMHQPNNSNIGVTILLVEAMNNFSTCASPFLFSLQKQFQSPLYSECKFVNAATKAYASTCLGKHIITRVVVSMEP